MSRPRKIAKTEQEEKMQTGQTQMRRVALNQEACFAGDKRSGRANFSNTQRHGYSGVIRGAFDKTHRRDIKGDRLSSIEMGGEEWSLEGRRIDGSESEEEHLSVALSCYLIRKRSWAWSIDVNVEFTLVNKDSSKNITKKYYRVLRGEFDTRVSRPVNLANWSDIIEPEAGYMNDDELIIEARFALHNMVVFKIEGTRTLAGKDFLSIHSSFFTALFSPNFNEKSQEEIELNEVSDWDLFYLIKALYDPSFDQEGMRNRFLHLGDMYGIKAIVDIGESVAIEDVEDDDIQGMDEEDRLWYDYLTREQAQSLANKYRLIKLNMKCGDENIEENNFTKMSLCENFKEAKLGSIGYGSFPTIFFLNSIHNGIISVKYPRFESTDFDICGMQWSLDGKCTVYINEFQLSICLIANGNKAFSFNWRAEGVVEIEIAHPNPEKKDTPLRRQYDFAFNNSTCKLWTDELIIDGENGYLGKNKFIECSVTTRLFFRKLTGIVDVPHFDFTVPSSLSDVEFLIGDQKLYANKQYLSSHSSVLREMFEGAPLGKNEFCLDGIQYQDALDTFNWLSPAHSRMFRDDKFDTFRSIAQKFDIPFIGEEIRTYLDYTSPKYAHLAQKIVDCTKKRTFNTDDLNSVISPVRRYMHEDARSHPSWLFNLLQKSRCYQELESEKKVMLLEWLHSLPGSTRSL